MVKAILYDLDGVLVDACDIHYRALNQALREISNFEISTDNHINIFNGLPTSSKLELLVKQGVINNVDVRRITDLKQKYTMDALNQLTIDDSKTDLHKKIKSLGIRIACITNAIRLSAEVMLRNTGQLDYIDYLVSNQDVKHPKPSSEGYIKTMVKLGVYPDEVLIVEDSPKGLVATTGTGAKVLKVANATEVNWNTISRQIDNI